jgi:hypothetical protein
MANVLDIISGALVYLGDPRPEQLNLGTALQVLYDQIDLYITDLQLARQNWLLQKWEFIPSDRDVLVTASNFDIPVRLEILTSTTAPISDDDYMDIRMVEHAELGNARKDGDMACAFYGIGPQTRLTLSFDPQGQNMRLWYEPIVAPPQLLTDVPKLNNAFHTMLKYATAVGCLPLTKGIDPQWGSVHLQELKEKLKRWERNWDLWRLEARDMRLNHKTPFNHRRKVVNFW